jgi:vitamin B12 transporter
MKKFLFLFLIGCNSGSFAQKDTLFRLPMTEVSSQRLQSFATGQTLIASDSFSLQLFQNQPLSQYLQYTSPLAIKAYGSGIATVGMRGLGTNHTTIVWNGINIQNPMNGLLDLDIMETGSAQRVNVQMGGCSALCGASAIGGMILLDNQSSGQQGFHAEIGGGYGTTDWRYWKMKARYETAKNSFNFRITQQKADNDFAFRNTSAIGQPLERAVNSDYNLLTINGSWIFSFGKKDVLKTHFWGSQNFRRIVPTMTTVSDNALYRDTSYRLTSEWSHYFKKVLWKTRVAYLFDNNFYASEVIKNSQNGIRSWVGESEYFLDISANNSLRVGINNTLERSVNNNYVENHVRHRLAFFINEKIRTRWADLTANVRHEWVDAASTPMSFAIGAERDIFPQKENRRLWSRAAVSRNFSLPTFNDLYWANLGNPNLINELGLSKELGISFLNIFKNKKWEHHLTFFHINIDNRIAWLPQSDGKWRPTNIEEVLSRGIETWSVMTVKTSSGQYKIRGQYQFVKATDATGGTQLYLPQHSGSVSFWWQYRKHFISWQQTASSRRFAATDRSTFTKPFTTADLTVGHHFFWAKKVKTDLQLQIFNLFNTDYQVIPFYPNPKRQFRVSAFTHF